MVAMRPLVSSNVRPPSPSPSEPGPGAVPGPTDWAVLYDDIERLYVRERRKLRYVMRFVEAKYHLKAT